MRRCARARRLDGRNLVEAQEDVSIATPDIEDVFLGFYEVPAVGTSGPGATTHEALR